MLVCCVLGSWKAESWKLTLAVGVARRPREAKIAAARVRCHAHAADAGLLADGVAHHAIALKPGVTHALCALQAVLSLARVAWAARCVGVAEARVRVELRPVQVVVRRIPG